MKAKDTSKANNLEQFIEVLRKSESKFRNLAEQSSNMIFINKGSRVVYANKKCADLTGYKMEEFYAPKFDFMALGSPESRNIVQAAYISHFRGEDVSPYKYTLITKDGRRINTIIHSKLIEYEQGNAIIGILTDITDK
jgi:PAS domain S-box-containing protein